MIRTGHFLQRLARPVPRYTSYPTAPQFRAGAGKQILADMMRKVGEGEDVSVYVHVPYCDRLCWFCGCHTKHTLRYEPVAEYVSSLVREIRTAGSLMATRPRIAQLHFGGGSPSMMRRAEFERLAESLNEVFDLDARSEISVEIDPSDVDEGAFEALAAIGMTRASIGVQDFDPDVQAAINRPKSYESTRDVVAGLRAMGVSSLNIDALYGLPRQSLARLMATMENILELAPDRIALFGYAHVPWLKKHQQMIAERDLADIPERFRQAEEAARVLTAAGYRPIGIDHFALPGDSLSRAAEEGRLHRNFQGYTTDNCGRLFGFGASAIGNSPEGYYQNEVAIGGYRRLVEDGDMSAGKGLPLTQDDRIRAWMIERLMCDFEIDFAKASHRFGAVIDPYVGEARRHAALDADGISYFEGGKFGVMPEARSLTRIVASWFDAYLESGEQRYSKAV